MDHRLADLLKLMQLERLEMNLFRGESRDIGAPQVFGGQVLGQALVAAYATIDAQPVHSLHAYFLRRGDFTAPIVYEVDCSRNGHSFTNRRVIAIQRGEQIFNMAASFQNPEDGFEHQIPMPVVVPPEELTDLNATTAEQRAKLPERLRRSFERESAFEFRQVQQFDLLNPQPAPSLQQVWFRAVDKLPDDDMLHRCLLAYVSDYHLLTSSMRPHGIAFTSNKVMVASIDHAMWFHRAARMDEWLLYSIDSPSASGARGFARASIFKRDGTLVASTAQEGLIRVVRPS
ncbi:MAG: acyl-CoA thioesterase II [Steroidobacteraceae bacterium]